MATTPGTAYGTKIANRLNLASFIIPLSRASAKNRDKDQHDRHLDDQEERHPADAAQEQRVGEGPDVVLEAGEGGAADQPLLEERQVPGVDQRHDDHGQEDDEERQHQRVGGAVLAALGRGEARASAAAAVGADCGRGSRRAVDMEPPSGQWLRGARHGTARRRATGQATVKPWSLAYLAQASCQACRPATASVLSANALPRVSLKFV